MKQYVLDANALYRFVSGGLGAEIVEQLFEQARESEQPLRMSVVNWGEVYYSIARSQGFARASAVMDIVKVLPLAIVDTDQSQTTQAARLKAAYGLPYADGFAAALLGPADVLVTSDVKDFKKAPGLHILALPEHKK
jgi:predicted nucleic acid-binding protein